MVARIAGLPKITATPTGTIALSDFHILTLDPMLPVVENGLDAIGPTHRLWKETDRDGALTRLAPQIRALVARSGGAPVDDALLARLPNLEMVSSFGVGYDHIDAAAAARRKVVVTHTPGVLDDEVADTAIALVLSAVRQIPQADRYVREGRWEKAPFPLTASLAGRKLGIFGLGRIGKAIARRAEAFGLEIAYHGRRRQDDVAYPYHARLEDLARAVDILVAVAPGGPETAHAVNRAVLQALGPNGVFVNVGRGSLVDEPALIEALRAREIMTAGLDVFADEPHVPEALRAMEHVVLLPHVGSATAHTRDAMGRLTVDNVAAWAKGLAPLTPVPETPRRV